MDKEVSSQSLESDFTGHEARFDVMKSIMWRSTDFLRHVAGEIEEIGAVTFTYVCEHCNRFPMEDVLWWVTVNHSERRTTNIMSGCWCGVCGKPHHLAENGFRFLGCGFIFRIN